jgi:hypothetical protein
MPTTDPSPTPTAQRSAVARFFTNPGTGELAIAQWPNAPLLIFLVATAVRLLVHPEGTAGTLLAIVSGAAVVVWSVLEIARGDSPFRRVLGAVVLVATVAGLLSR